MKKTAAALSLSLFVLLAAPLSFAQEQAEESSGYVIKERERKKKGILGFGTSVEAEELGSGTIFLRNTAGTKAVSCAMAALYFPTQDEVVLKFRSFGMNNFACFNREMRDALNEAFDSYERDFEGRRLDDRNRKSYKAYGTMYGKYRRGVLNGASVAKPRTHFGYRFLKGRPYFCITYEETLAEHPGQSAKNAEFFEGNWILFSCAQIKALEPFFDEQNISALMQEAVPAEDSESSGPHDEYKGFLAE